MARLLHHRSARAAAPLVTLNCAGLPDALIESELFGHVRGSFTGAHRDKPGLLETGRHGTVFLDEVGEMSARMQAVLLRFLESGEIQRVGADRPRTVVDVRVITATNRDLETAVDAGRFRQDLYFRLNVIRFMIPALRERPDDIPVLAAHYVHACSAACRLPPPQLAPDALDALKGYSWPGNVRQLRNVVERLVLRNPGVTIHAADLRLDVIAFSAGAVRVPDSPEEAPPAASVADELMDRLCVNAIRSGRPFIPFSCPGT